MEHELELQIIEEAVAIIRKHPENANVLREQLQIIERAIRSIRS